MSAVKPSNLVYGLEDRPPLWATLLMGVQHISVMFISFVFPVVVVRQMGGDYSQSAFMVSMAMLAGGVGTILQALRRGPMGSGYLCPPVCGPSFLSATVLAAQTGGLALVMGMTLCAGGVEALLSRVMHKLRVVFPPEVTGVIVAMVGITVIKVGVVAFFGLEADDDNLQWQEVAVACFTLAAMMGLNVWSKGKIKLFCVLVGMVLGYAASIALGLLHGWHFASLANRPWVSLPILDHPGWSFDLHLLAPFAIATVCSTIKSVGDLATCQKINNANWRRADMKNISGGILADASGTLMAGLLGGYGQSTSSTNVALSLATGATSRVIAFATGGLLIALAFLPKFAGVFAIIPAPVMGAVLIFALSFMVVAGFQIVMSRMLDARKTFVVGISIIFGLSVDVIPEAYAHLPDWLQPVFASSLSTTAVLAVLLNLVFRIGIAKTVDLKLSPGDRVVQKVFDFMETWGRHWGARPEAVQAAAAAATEALEVVLPRHQGDGPVNLRARFDEFNLDLTIRYHGQVMDLPHDRPQPEQVLEGGELGAQLLAGYMAKSLADKAISGRDAKGSYVRLHFEH